MTSRPHDSERILETLGEAIEALRFTGNHDFKKDRFEVANDLALLHGAVSAERAKADKQLADVLAALEAEDKGLQRDLSYFRRTVLSEEIEDEVLRGEHDDHDWEVDG